MAIIGKIREKSVLVIVLVGLSLVLFILGDFLTNQRGGPLDTSIGEAYGEPIDGIEYDRRVREMTEGENARREAMGQPTLSETEVDQMRENVWNQLVGEIISKRELAHFPFSVPKEELNDMIYGVNIHPAILSEPGFKDAMGQFSKDSLVRYLNALEAPNDQARAAKEQWIKFEQNIKEERMNIKYSTLISKAVYVTNAEAKRHFEDNNRIYKIRYVVKKYFDIPDSMVTVTDEDIRAYYEKNKFRKQYEQPGSRVFEYVQFPLIPTKEDRIKMEAEMNEIKDGFAKASNDSSYVMLYSDNKYFNSNYSVSGEFSPTTDSLIQNADSGAIVGPYEEFGYLRLTKIRGVKYEPEARVRHILLGKEKGEIADLKKRADSIRTVIRRNNNFEEMVTKFTDDPGSMSNGGVYDWFPKGRMVEPFENAAFNGKVGDLQIVETDYGIHIVEVLGQRQAKRVKYATIDKKIVPSSETEEAVRMLANEFLEKINDGSKFEEYAKKEKLVTFENEVMNIQHTLNGDDRSRELIRFVQTGAKNDVSDAITYGDNIVIAHIVSVKEKGVPEFEDIKDIMMIPTRQDKKAELLKKQMSGAKSIEDVASKANTIVQDVEVNFGSTTIKGGGGNEPVVIGTIFSLTPQNKGAMTVPIQGKTGVYVVQLVDVIEPAQTSDYATSKNNLITVRRNRAGGDAFKALKENAKIVDKRTAY